MIDQLPSGIRVIRMSDIPDNPPYTYTPRKKILVVAGSFQQFRNFLGLSDLGRDKAIYIHKEEQLLIFEGCDLYFYGAYSNNPITRSVYFSRFVEKQASAVYGTVQGGSE